jgi:uncharacterized protein involved in exopolysaccharide biosynthesis
VFVRRDVGRHATSEVDFSSFSTLHHSTSQPRNDQAQASNASPSAVASQSGIAAGGPDFWMMLHRALRGRYGVVLTLSAGFAVAGAWAGFTLGQRVYSATGLVRIASSLPAVMRETDQNRTIPNFDGYLQAQRDTIMSREMIEAAMASEAWQQFVASGDGMSEQQFAKALKVDVRPRSDHLKISFSHTNPELAASAVRSVVGAYEASFQDQAGQFESERQQQLEGRRATLAKELGTLESQVRQVANGATTAELDVAIMVASDRIKKLKGALVDAQNALLGGISPSRSSQPVRSPEEVANAELLRVTIAELVRAEEQLAQVKSQGFTAQHRLVKRLETLVQDRKARVEELRAASVAAANTETAPEQDASLEEKAANLIAMVSQAERELRDATTRRSELTALNAKAATVRQSLQETDTRLDALKTEASASNRLTVISAGDVPMSPALDNRLKSAAFGGFVAGVGSLAAFVMLASIRRRSRFSSDVSDDLRDRVPFVMALPDVLHTPGLASDAVHRVHELRMRLQPRTASDRRTLLISGAGEQDGGSGLALSLALSFVSAGFRTLLIDGNLAMRRLSDKLEAGTCPGLTDATHSGEPLLWKTSAGFSFLSAGTGDAMDACRLSPTSTGKVLAYLRERFDVVLIDSDSMTGGLVAPTIAPLADGVVLKIKRGQDMSSVRAAAELVESLGGVIACAAFNDASASEFPGDHAQSSLVQVPVSQAERLGALAAVMADSLHLNSDDDFHLNAGGLPINPTGSSKRAA